MTAWRRGSPLLIISMLCFTVFYSAQLFTSMIWTTAGDRFLIQNGVCGRLDALGGSMDGLLLLNRYWIDRIEEASIYERQCYSSLPNPGRCEKLPIPRIAWTMQNSACPFTDPNLCTDDAVAVRMDTGYINSNSDLGANARSEDSIVYRKVVTCSPLKTHFSVLDNNDPADRVLRYWYGRNNLFDTDYTFEYSMNMSINRAYKTTYELFLSPSQLSGIILTLTVPSSIHLSIRTGHRTLPYTMATTLKCQFSSSRRTESVLYTA